MADAGYRAIAYDRHGHGRSTQTSHGNEMHIHADDLAELLDQLEVSDPVLVRHSTGGGEVVCYLARHGQDRVAKAVLLGAVPPLMLMTDNDSRGRARANQPVQISREPG